MTTSSEPTITLGEAFDSVELPLGAAQSVLQWIGQMIGHDTEAGRAISAGGANLTAPETPPVRTASASTSSTSSKS